MYNIIWCVLYRLMVWDCIGVHICRAGVLKVVLHSFKKRIARAQLNLPPTLINTALLFISTTYTILMVEYTERGRTQMASQLRHLADSATLTLQMYYIIPMHQFGSPLANQLVPAYCLPILVSILSISSSKLKLVSAAAHSGGLSTTRPRQGFTSAHTHYVRACA